MQGESNPYKRHKTRHRGISYRERAYGSRSYSVYWQGKYLPAGTKEAEALARQSELRRASARGERVIVPSKLTVSEVGQEHLTEVEARMKRGKEYRRAFEKVVVPAWGERGIASITPQDILTLDHKLRDAGLSEATVANYLKPARGTFEYAVLQGYIGVNPFTQVPRGRLSSCNVEREHREWTTADVETLIECGYEQDARKEARAEYGLAIEMKLRTGARLGELLGARYQDIDHKSGIWTISAQWTRDNELTEPKTKKSLRRVVIEPPLLRKIAARKLSMGARDEDYIFSSRKGGLPISHSNFRKRGWKPAVELAELTDGPKVTPHDARHAYASEMNDLGCSSSDLAEMMGHATSAITERIYTHVFNREAREDRIRAALVAARGA